MRAGLDTGYFVLLLQNHTEAVELYRSILSGKVVGVVPVIVCFELKRLALRGAVDREAYDTLEKAWEVLFHVEPATLEASLEAAIISHSTGLSAADALIYAVCKRAGCQELWTTDRHFSRVRSRHLHVRLLEAS